MSSTSPTYEWSDKTVSASSDGASSDDGYDLSSSNSSISSVSSSAHSNAQEKVETKPQTGKKSKEWRKKLKCFGDRSDSSAYSSLSSSSSSLGVSEDSGNTFSPKGVGSYSGASDSVDSMSTSSSEGDAQTSEGDTSETESSSSSSSVGGWVRSEDSDGRTVLTYRGRTVYEWPYAPSRTPTSNDEVGAVGVVNMGNTCFLNSVLQCLSNTVPFREGLMEIREDGSVVGELANLFRAMWSVPVPNAVRPVMFKQSINRHMPYFGDGSQHDAQEFLRMLLEAVHDKCKAGSPPRVPRKGSGREQWKAYKKEEGSFVVDTFGGQQKSVTRCGKCGKRYIRYEPFLDLSLPLVETREGECTIGDCLQKYVEEEVLEDWKCDKCGAKRGRKQLLITELPPILVVHLKRFAYTRTFRRRKIKSDVDFPQLEFTLDYALDDGLVSPKYNLYAMVNHSGSAQFGHYTAHARNSENYRLWYTFNDSRVGPYVVSNNYKTEGYVLFYEREDVRQ